MRHCQVAYHLGAHKTASSLLQKYLRDEPEVLRRHRLVYLGRSEMNDLVGWGKRLLTRPELLEARIGELLAQPGAHTLVASHENTLGPPLKPGADHLYPRGPDIVEQLAHTLAAWSSRVLLYLRPQDEFLESYYLQRIHQGDVRSFHDWLDELDLEQLSWRPVVAALHERFGPEQVEIVDFGRIRAGQDRFLADFLRRIDPAIDEIPDYRPVRNPSISEKGLRIALAANPHLRSDWERKAMRRFLQRHFSNRRYPRPVLLSDAQRSWLRQRYGQEYEQLTGAAMTPLVGDEPGGGAG